MPSSVTKIRHAHCAFSRQDFPTGIFPYSLLISYYSSYYYYYCPCFSRSCTCPNWVHITWQNTQGICMLLRVFLAKCFASFIGPTWVGKIASQNHTFSRSQAVDNVNRFGLSRVRRLACYTQHTQQGSVTCTTKCTRRARRKDATQRDVRNEQETTLAWGESSEPRHMEWTRVAACLASALREKTIT